MEVTLLYTAVLLSILSDQTGGDPSEPANRVCPSRCDVSSCPSPSCPSGYVPDRCNCCLVCARAEGEPCAGDELPPCGDGLECRYPAGKRLSRGSCKCRLSQEVCGSDGRTYGNVCQLRATSRRALLQGLEAVSQAHQGPCEGDSGTRSPAVAAGIGADSGEQGG